jgi:caffeoyl-CoA O-methyltransferase
MSDELFDYVIDHTNPRSDSVSEQLAATTRERFPTQAGMNIGGDQGRFLKMLVEITGASNVVEVGTFTGMSALWLARGLPQGGRLTCFDITDEFLPTAREAWEAAGVSDRINVVIGPAADSLAELPETHHVDVAFIDADKPGYRTYLDLLLPRMSDRGLILVDNVLWSGAVVDHADNSSWTVAIREFNDHVAERADCESVILSVGDGVMCVRPSR